MDLWGFCPNTLFRLGQRNCSKILIVREVVSHAGVGKSGNSTFVRYGTTRMTMVEGKRSPLEDIKSLVGGCLAPFFSPNLSWYLWTLLESPFEMPVLFWFVLSSVFHWSSKSPKQTQGIWLAQFVWFFFQAVVGREPGGGEGFLWLKKKKGRKNRVLSIRASDLMSTFSFTWQYKKKTADGLTIRECFTWWWLLQKLCYLSLPLWIKNLK